MRPIPQFVDTNIFIRHFTQDNEQQSPACTALFEKAERNEVSLTTTEAVITEVVYILGSKSLYQFPRDQIQIVLTTILSLPSMKLMMKPVFIQALDLYAQENIDFADCLIVAHMRAGEFRELYSFDHHFNRFEEITRLEP